MKLGSGPSSDVQVAGVEPTGLLSYGQRLTPHEHLRGLGVRRVGIEPTTSCI
jgi:hypothetical protein